MPLTTIDPKTALVLIDLQRGIVAQPTAHPTSEIIKRARDLSDGFRRNHLPVVLVNVTAGAAGRTEQPRRGESPAGWSDLVPELDQQPEDHCVTKKTWGAFFNTDLEQYLKDQSVTQVVIAGIATSMGVESTARQAHERGFNVTLAIDAMTDMNADAHLNSTTRVFPKLGETGTTEEIIALLESTRPNRQ
jgi:nicotinamidase-related amidase